MPDAYSEDTCDDLAAAIRLHSYQPFSAGEAATLATIALRHLAERGLLQHPALGRACLSVWLHGDWRWLTKNMTTEEKEAFADAVDRSSATLDEDEPATVDRWWRDA